MPTRPTASQNGTHVAIVNFRRVLVDYFKGSDRFGQVISISSKRARSRTRNGRNAALDKGSNGRQEKYILHCIPRCASAK